MWREILILFLIVVVKLGHSLPQRSDCSSSKKCVTSSSLNRPCSSYFDCKFQPEGCEDSMYLECDGSQCLCELFGFTRDDFGPLLTLNWDQKGGMCGVSEGGPCGKDDGIEIKCDTGYECIDSKCLKMTGRQKDKKSGCGQKGGCHDLPAQRSAESPHKNSRNNGWKEDPRPERQSNSKSRVKPKRIEMDSESGETERMMPRGDSEGRIFPPSTLRSRSSSCGGRGGKKRSNGDRDCGPEGDDDDEDNRGSKSGGGCGGRGKGQGGCGGGGGSKSMGSRPNGPKPCREGNGNCGGGGGSGSKRPATTTKRPSSSCGGGGSGGCRKTTTTPPPSSGCGGGGRESGGCGKRKERGDRPSSSGCGGNGNSGCGGGGGSSSGRRPSSSQPGRPTDKGCKSENGGCGRGGGGQGSSGRPKTRPGPTPCKGGGGDGCEAEVTKSKPKSNCGGGKGSGGCGGMTSTTAKPTSCKEDNSCEEQEDDKDEETRCDKFFPKLFSTTTSSTPQCPRGI